MDDSLFHLRFPRDMLEKAKRELHRLQSDLSIDNIFNFFVTAYHIVDYVRAQGKASKSEIEELYMEEDFKMVRFICNKGKHLSLREDAPYGTFIQPGSALGEFTIGMSRIGMSRDFLIVGEKTVLGVIELAERIINRWEEFFRQHRIDEE